jgi:hypothetical protein
MTLDAIRQQLPKDRKISLALDGWTSTNKLAISSVIAYFINDSWDLTEIQLAFEQVCLTSSFPTSIMLFN